MTTAKLDLGEAAALRDLPYPRLSMQWTKTLMRHDHAAIADFRAGAAFIANYF
jgi:hypothetical protein